jgi:hypothetical protein
MTAIDLRLQVSHLTDGGRYEPVATTHSRPGPLTRDMKRVPVPPDRVRLRTGDRVRVEVVADRAGYVAVFNVGPAGHLNVQYPEDLSSLAPDLIEAHRPLHILDVEMAPPADRERLFAVWSRQPLRFEHLAGLADRGAAASPPYRATRDMKRVQESVHRLRPEDRHAVVVEVDHAQ